MFLELYGKYIIGLFDKELNLEAKVESRLFQLSKSETILRKLSTISSPIQKSLIDVVHFSL